MRRNFGSLVGLAGGLLIGQGSFFLVQTWLLAQHKFDVVSQVGVAISVVSFLQWLVDFGGVIVLNTRHQGGAVDHLPSVLLFRAIGALVLVVLLGVIVCVLPVEPVQRSVILGGGLGLVAWSSNLSGLTDALGENRVLGWANGLPWLLLSFTLVLRAGSTTPEDGLWYGAAFGAGLILAVAVQHLWMLRRSPGIYRGGLRTEYAREYWRDAAPYVLSNIPSQLLPRYMLMIVDVVLGGVASAAYVYARTMQNAAFQLLTVVRRIEFTTVVASISSGEMNSWRDVLKSQRFSLALSVLGMVLIWIWCGAMAWHTGQSAPYVAASLVALLVPIWTFSSMHAFAYLAAGKSRVYAKGVIFLVMPVAITPLLLPVVGIAAAVIGESAMYVSQLLFYRTASKEIWSRE
jgi:hypothetical protein